MTVVLARLLTPADFGLFALAMVITNLFDYAKDLGVGAALVQNRGTWERLAPTGLTLTAISGICTGVLVAAAAGPISAAMGHEPLAPLIRALALCVAISALGAFPAAALRRRLDFRARLLPEFSGTMSKTLLTIGLAWQGVGVWSLVYGQLVAVTVTTAMYWRTARVGIRPGYDRVVAADLIRFGLPATILSLLAFAIYNVDYLSIGARLGDTDLGLYTLAYRLPELIVLSLCAVVGEVLFSALSNLQHDPRALRDEYLKVLGVVVALTAPIGLGMAAVAPDVIGVLYGSQYSGAAGALAVLSIFTVLYSIGFHTGDVYKAIGRPGVLGKINAVKLLVMIGPIWWAAGHGIVAVAAVLVAVEVAHLALRIAVVNRVISMPIAGIAKAVVGPVAVAVVMAGIAWSAAQFTEPWPDFLALLAIVPLAAIVYLAGLKVVCPDLVANILKLLRPRREVHQLPVKGNA